LRAHGDKFLLFEKVKQFMPNNGEKAVYIKKGALR
jgi:hypothetical protein